MLVFCVATPSSPKSQTACEIRILRRGNPLWTLPHINLIQYSLKKVCTNRKRFFCLFHCSFFPDSVQYLMEAPPWIQNTWYFPPSSFTKGKFSPLLLVICSGNLIRSFQRLDLETFLIWWKHDECIYGDGGLYSMLDRSDRQINSSCLAFSCVVIFYKVLHIHRML